MFHVIIIIYYYFIWIAKLVVDEPEKTTGPSGCDAFLSLIQFQF